MLLRKLREKRYIHKHIKVPLAVLFAKIDVVRAHSSVLAVCSATTGFNWMGVNTATHNLFPDATFEFPQYYSHSVYSEKELQSIARYIAALHFTTVVLNGFPGYFALFARLLKSADSQLMIAAIYHGSLSELAGNQKLRTNFAALVDLLNENIIGRIGFVKKGLPEFFEQTYGVPAVPIILPPPFIDSNVKPQKFNDGKLHIGVFASNQFRKNVHNQVAAGLMTSNSIVHLFANQEMDIYRQNERLVMHPGNMKRTDFLSLLGSMNINLYNTYTETWGQVVVESLSIGVPCLTNNSSGVLDASPELKKLLVVEEHDNPAAIAEAITKVQLKINDVQRFSGNFLQAISEKSEELVRNFISDTKV